MAKILHGYINIYRSGHYHRCGKPSAFNRHGGDIYPTHMEAFAAVDPQSHYVATVPLSWEDADSCCVNEADSTPIPLSATRGNV